MLMYQVYYELIKCNKMMENFKSFDLLKRANLSKDKDADFAKTAGLPAY